MALALYDRVQEVTTTAGTGSLALSGAVGGYQSFAVVGDGNTCFYTIVDGTAWEVGLGTYSSTGPTLARTTIYSNSNGNTSPITLSSSANTKSVFLTYPAEKSVNLNESGNVSALGTISSATWQASTIGVAYGGTGVTSSAGANSVVLRDSNSNITINNFIAGAAAVTASGTTTTLTASSSRTQILVGSTAQTFQLPDATTMSLGQSFIFVNNSTGGLTVKDNSGATVEFVPSGGVTQLGAVSVATSAGAWGSYSFIPAAVDWGTNSLNLATTVVSGGTWNGGTIQPAYGGTGLTSFSAANNAIYSTGATTLTAGTLPFAAGGTGATSYSANYVPYVNGTNTAFASSSAFQFNGSYLIVGGTTPLSGTTNPITAFSSTANNYVQTYVYNANTGISASADFVAYSNNSTDTHGWVDMGFTSSTYADTTYTVTGPNEAYLLGSAPSGAGATGNLVYATDNTGSANAHQWYVGGFTQAKSAWKMQLTSTGLQLANALATNYGGTGLTGFTAANNAIYSTSSSALTAGTLPVAAGGTGLSSTPTNGQIDIGNGTGFTRSTLTGTASQVTVTNSAGGITLSLPSTINVNTSGSAGSVTNAVTFNSSGTGAASGSTYNGSGAVTISYNTIGAQAAGTAVTSVTGTAPVVSSGGTTPAISMAAASSTTNGYLTSTDWNTFNGKGTVTSVSGTAPIVSSGGSTPAISIPAATTAVSGYLTSTDWNTFNNKLSTAVTSAAAGTGISVSASTGAVTFTNSGVTSAVAGTGVTVSGATGAVTFSIGQAVATTSNVQFNSLGVGTAASGTAGEIRATNNVTAYYSDERLKTKLGKIENALDKIDSLSGFYYEANQIAQDLGYDVKREVGVSAQEVQAVMPEIVAPAPIDDRYLTVRYERLAPLFIEAIKELRAEVKSLKEEVESLKYPKTGA